MISVAMFELEAAPAEKVTAEQMARFYFGKCQGVEKYDRPVTYKYESGRHVFSTDIETKEA